MQGHGFSPCRGSKIHMLRGTAFKKKSSFWYSDLLHQLSKFLINLNIWQPISLRFLTRESYYLFHYSSLCFGIAVYGCILVMQSSPGLNSRVGTVPPCPLLDFIGNICKILHLYMFAIDLTVCEFHSNVSFLKVITMNFYQRFFLYSYTWSNAFSSLSDNIVNSSTLCWQSHSRGDTEILFGDPHNL